MPVRNNRPGADSARARLAPGPVLLTFNRPRGQFNPTPDPTSTGPGASFKPDPGSTSTGPGASSTRRPEPTAYRPRTPTRATTANATITIPDPMFTQRSPRASNLER